MFDQTYAVYVQFKPIQLKQGKKQSAFKIGVRIDVPIQQLLVTWRMTSGGTGYIPIRPLFLNFVKTSGVLIEMDQITQVPSGGRSRPVYVRLSRAPYDTLTVNVRMFGGDLPLSSVAPTSMAFRDGRLTDAFWVSIGALTTGTAGTVLAFMTGAARDVYYFPNRLQSFIVSQPDTEMPFIFRYNVDPKPFGFDFYVQTSKACTVYFFVGGPVTVNDFIDFEQIKQKKL